MSNFFQFLDKSGAFTGKTYFQTKNSIHGYRPVFAAIWTFNLKNIFYALKIAKLVFFNFRLILLS